MVRPVDHTFRVFLTFRLIEKQTVEFNLKVRANFKKTVRARMGASSLPEACCSFR